jgi:hypothetical protein
MAKEKEQTATIFLNTEEVWHGAWWKVWRRVLSLVADNRDKAVVIVVVLGGKE